MASFNTYNTPCAACKFLRRKCMPGCIFAPYFPPEEPQKFANVHKIFGASNVTKLLNEIIPHQRDDAVNSLAYEAEARVRDPVYGCVGALSFLQMQVDRLQKELDAANADLIRYATSCTNDHFIPAAILPPPAAAAPPYMTSMAVHHHHHPRQRPVLDGGPNTFYQAPSTFSFPYPFPWTYSSCDHNPSAGDINGGGGGAGARAAGGI